MVSLLQGNEVIEVRQIFEDWVTQVSASIIWEDLSITYFIYLSFDILPNLLLTFFFHSTNHRFYLFNYL